MRALLPSPYPASTTLKEYTMYVNNLKIAYYKAGKGPLLLLLHGWGQSKETWLSLFPFLTKDFTTVAVDLPNFGRSMSSQTLISIDQYCNFLLKFIHSFEKKPTFIVGHSFGGKIALHFSFTYPHYSKKIILISTSVLVSQKISFLKHICFHFISIFIPLFSQKDVQRFLMQRLTVLKRSSTFSFPKDILKKLSMPTLLIYGAYDFIIPTPLFTNTKNLKVIILQGSTHLPHQEETKQCAEILLRFLKK